MKKKPSIYIGTSGWSYSHWKENFYPNGLKQKDWLHFYSQTFPTVEINTTFYHTPKESTVKNWHQVVESDFVFSVKASRYITHQKKLKDCQENVDFFYKSLESFKEKVGPILFQLPPSFQINQERLEEFIGYLSKSYRYTFEFRHDSWYCEEIYKLLEKQKIALCITDLNGKQTPEIVTADFTYLRLHGPHKAYQGSYGTRRLKVWHKKIDEWKTSDISTFCYFDNDEKGYAIEDAKMLQSYF